MNSSAELTLRDDKSVLLSNEGEPTRPEEPWQKKAKNKAKLP